MYHFLSADEPNMSDEEFFKSYQRLDNLRKACKLNRIVRPRNTYDTLAQLARALSISNGDEKGALNVLSAKLNKADKKRVHSTTASRFDTSGSHNIDEYEEQAAEFVEDKAEKSSPKGYESEDEDDKPVRKCLRLEGDSSVKSAGDLTNQDVKDVFTSYTEQQRTEERPTDNKTHRLVLLIRNARTMCLGNQFLVDELAKFGKRCFDARKGSLGTFYLRAARQLQLTDIEITSGSQARKNMAFVGSAIAGKIDQILQSEDGDGIDDVEDNSNCRVHEPSQSHGERPLAETQPHRGVAYIPAVHCLREAAVTATSSMVGKTLSFVKDKVAMPKPPRL